MPADTCSVCGEPVRRGKNSRPEIVCRECRWERRIVAEAERTKLTRSESASKAARTRWQGERADPPCGTRAGYDLHRANGEDCEQCRKSESARRAATGYAKRGKCARCGKPVHRGRNSKDTIVCHECRRERPEPRVFPVKRECDWPGCGTVFMVLPSNKRRYCSQSCGSKAANLNRDRKGESPEALARRKALVRARRLRVTQSWDGISDEEIMDRDQWMCWICRRRISKTRKWPHPRSPSIDHLIPLALGGDDTAFNKKAAHLNCNVRRGIGKADEQPMLNFSLDPDVEIKPRTPRKPVYKPRPCKMCGELREKGKPCDLHMPVKYGTCKRCAAPMVKQGRWQNCQACRTRQCAVSTCEDTVFFAATDWCAAHHHRHAKYGDVLAHIPTAVDHVDRVAVADIRRGIIRHTLTGKPPAGQPSLW